MSRVLVAHPGLQHSHQLAWALWERGLLQAYWSGVPVTFEDEPLPLWLPPKYAARIRKVGIPAAMRKHPAIFQALLRTGAMLPRALSGSDWAHRVFHSFDWWVAKQLVKIRPRVVVASENSAYHTFRAAKAIGARCILDAPALHHASAARLSPVKPTSYLPEINRRKDEEVCNADLILTCSPLAAESYARAGVPEQKIHPILLGATVSYTNRTVANNDRPLHFVFAGALRELKAIDVILKAFGRLNSDGLAYRLSFVGGQAEPGWVRKIQSTPFAAYHAAMPQPALHAMFANADCLLLPSRFDSFGMVVAEAMACGTPAIVSTNTGAKAIIEQFPGAGWIVECAVDSVYHRVKELIEGPNALFEARAHALEASRHFTWATYRQRAGDYIEKWLA